ncbi:MAG: response regulator transcription factor [Bacteroidales bacterium]|nr:response regulator transcription factor [Bacteroidales bacterium]
MLKAVIIDDEHDAVNFISSLIKEYCPEIEVAGTGHSAIEGIKIIRDTNPDILFLDVEMPHGSGFDLLENFPKKTFDVIFITAFNHYAINAIKFSAIDYILKPININEFLEAVKKVETSRSEKMNKEINFEALFENIRAALPSKLGIPTSNGMEYLNTKDIVRIEADRSYSRFFLIDGKQYLVSRNLKEYQELLSGRNFFRSHNSHLINLDYVKKYYRHDGGYIEMIDGSTIGISRNKKDLFLTQMARFTK